jgi:hypothetical protein
VLLVGACAVGSPLLRSTKPRRQAMVEETI